VEYFGFSIWSQSIQAHLPEIHFKFFNLGFFHCSRYATKISLYRLASNYYLNQRKGCSEITQLSITSFSFAWQATIRIQPQFEYLWHWGFLF